LTDTFNRGQHFPGGIPPKIRVSNLPRYKVLNPTLRDFWAQGWDSEWTSPEERGPIESPLKWNRETDRVFEGISEGCRSAEPERVAPGGTGAIEPQPRVDDSKLKRDPIAGSLF
jgi:hypothetical protein